MRFITVQWSANETGRFGFYRNFGWHFDIARVEIILYKQHSIPHLSNGTSYSPRYRSVSRPSERWWTRSAKARYVGQSNPPWINHIRLLRNGFLDVLIGDGAIFFRSHPVYRARATTGSTVRYSIARLIDIQRGWLIAFLEQHLKTPGNNFAAPLIGRSTRGEREDRQIERSFRKLNPILGLSGIH